VTLPIKRQILGQSRKLERGQPMTIEILAAKAIESGLCLHGKLSSQGFWRLNNPSITSYAQTNVNAYTYCGQVKLMHGNKD